MLFETKHGLQNIISPKQLIVLSSQCSYCLIKLVAIERVTLIIKFFFIHQVINFITCFYKFVLLFRKKKMKLRNSDIFDFFKNKIKNKEE